MIFYKESEAKKMIERLKLDQSKFQETMSYKTLQTADLTQNMQHSRNQHSTIPRDRDNDSSISPVSQIDPEQQEWLDRRDEIR